MAEPLSCRRAFVSLGSNIRPEIHLPAAAARLAALGKIRGVSRVWESPPVGDVQQANFCNAAVLLETELSAAALCGEHGRLRGIEAELGRVRVPGNKNAPRTIDLDLSLYGSGALQIGDRLIPDPDIVSRAFVAVPLAELDPAYRLPDGRTLGEVADSLRASTSLRERTDIVLGEALPQEYPSLSE